MSCGNQVRLTGLVKDKEPIRYTPAGVPILRWVLHHQSVQREAGHATQIQCRVAVQAAAEMADRIAAYPENVPITVGGFLAQAGMRRSDLILHVTLIE